MQNILNYLNLGYIHFTNVNRRGNYNADKNRYICFDVSDKFELLKIISDAPKLKNYMTKGIYVSKMLQGEEAKMQAIILKKRWQLIHIDLIPRSDIRISKNKLLCKGVEIVLDDPKKPTNTNVSKNTDDMDFPSHSN